MDLQWLEDFRKLAETGNFSRAAHLRNTTQSALSRRIQSLETWVGAKLFDRTNYPVQLTEAGRVFLESANDVLGRLAAGRQRASMTARKLDEPLVIATTHTIATEVAPRWLARMEAGFGRLSVRMEYLAVDRCFQALETGEAHFCLAAGEELPPGKAGGPERFASRLVELDELIPVSAPDEAGRSRFELPGDEAEPIPFLSISPEAQLGGAVRRMLTERFPPPSLDLCFESPQKGAVTSMVRAGRGLAWLPRSQVEADLESGRLVLSGTPDWAVPFEICLFRGVAPLPELGERLWRHLEDTGRPEPRLATA